MEHVAGLLGDRIITHWDRPDHGIWEIRGEPRHYVFGKILCWVALERLNRLLGADDWRLSVMREIERAVLERGTDHFLGNSPQAFTHLGFVHSASLLHLYEQGGTAALAGTPADRARRLVGATNGLRGLLAAFRKSGRVGRLVSSRHSIMPLDDT